MELKYELNDIVVAENLDKRKATIKIFQIIEDGIKVIVRGIDDSDFNIFESIFYDDDTDRVVWYSTKYNKYKNYDLSRNKYIEVSYTPNTLTIDINKKCFLNLKSGIDIGLLKFEEVKLLSLNLHLPMVSNKLSFDKLVYIINKFIWSLEKTIPVDVYYRNNDFGSNSNGYHNFLKIAVIIPGDLIKRLNSFIIVNNQKTNIIDLIKDVWVVTLLLNDIKLKSTKDLLSKTHYYNSELTYGDDVEEIAKFLNEISFSDSKTNLYIDVLTNDVIIKRLKFNEEIKKLNIDVFLLKISVTKKSKIEKIVSVLNEKLNGSFNYIKASHDETIYDIIGHIDLNTSLPVSLRTGYYLSSLFEMVENCANVQDTKFDLLEVLVGYDAFDFNLLKNRLKNIERIQNAISNFALYIANSSNTGISNLNKLKVTHRTFY